MYQPAAAALWTLTVLTQTVGMNHQPPTQGNPSQAPASQAAAAQPNPTAMGAGPHSGTSQQTPDGGHTQTHTASHQQQPSQQHCGPIQPADGWPATHGGTYTNTGPAIPWLPPWIANQHPNPAGGYTPMAATQFQWQATHPASNGALVTSWGGYSLAPGATQYQTPQGQPAVVFPPPQNSMQMLPQPATYGGQPPLMQPPQQQQQLQRATARPAQQTPGLPQAFRPHQQPHQQPPTSQPHAYQGPPSTPQQSTHNTYPHYTPPSTATARPGTPGLWAREYDPDTDPWHTPSDSPREPTQQQQQPPWAQHESPQPNPAFANNPPWSLTHEQAASLLAESPTIHAQKYKQDEQDRNQEPGSPPPLPPPSDAPPGLDQATSTGQHTSSGETEEATTKEDTGAPAEDTHRHWYHGSSPEEATAPSADTYWDPQWGPPPTNPLPTTTTLRRSPPPRQPPPLNRKPRHPPQLTQRRQHPPVPTVSSSRKPQQPPGLHHGNETRTGGLEEYPPAPHAEQKQQQAMGHKGFVTKPANMFTNSITSMVIGSGAHPLKAKGDRGGASCIDPRPQTTTLRRAAAAAAAGDSRAIAALATKVGGTTHPRLSRRHPSQGRRQTPMPENVSLTSSTDTCCHETRSRAACSKGPGQLTLPKPKQDRSHSSKTRQQAVHQQATHSTHNHTSHSQTNNHHHQLAPPRILPRRETPPTQPKQNGQPPNQISKPHQTSHRTLAFPQPQQPPPSSPRSPTAAGKSGFDRHNNQAAAVATRLEEETNEDYLSSTSLTWDKQDHWTEPRPSRGGRSAALRQCHKGTLGSS